MARIIVVEEDLLIRTLLVEWLSAEGYAVHGCARAETLADEGADLVIADVSMPRQRGAQTLRRVRAARPATPLIAISSQFRSESCGTSTARALAVRRAIGKPFTREQLLAVVRDVIGEAPP